MRPGVRVELKGAAVPFVAPMCGLCQTWPPWPEKVRGPWRGVDEDQAGVLDGGKPMMTCGGVTGRVSEFGWPPVPTVEPEGPGSENIERPRGTPLFDSTETEDGGAAWEMTFAPALVEAEFAAPAPKPARGGALRAGALKCDGADMCAEPAAGAECPPLLPAK